MASKSTAIPRQPGAGTQGPSGTRGPEWLTTPAGEPRGYIEPRGLEELWFHTGTACNLACPFCLEGSKPGDNRLERITLADARPLIDEAVELGVKQFSFTGGEPFIVKDIVRILDYALQHRPCMVLTNGTEPVLRRLHQIDALRAAPNPVSFRVSLDHYRPECHDAERGEGNFHKALLGMRALHERGFKVSVARQMWDSDDAAADVAFRDVLAEYGLPRDLNIVAFPELYNPHSSVATPEITEDCMTRYHTAETRAGFMCAFSKMVIKTGGRMRIYACTLVDDDEDYDQGATLREALSERVMLKHHRCFSCFKYGSSCSEM